MGKDVTKDKNKSQQLEPGKTGVRGGNSNKRNTHGGGHNRRKPPINEGSDREGVRGSELEASKNGVKPYNDVSYWFQNPEMARDAASVWFTQRVGTPIKGDGVITKDTPVGGIMRINFIPSFGVTGEVSSDGYSEFDTSAINQAFIKLDWDIVHANSRNISYEASDLGKYLIACGNVYIMLQDAVRVYAIMNKLSVENPYWGKILVNACGWDYDQLVGKIADFRYRLNQLITLVNRLYVPRVYQIFAAHLNLINRIFTDGDSTRAQMYVMVPNGYYTYNDSNGEVIWHRNEVLDESGVTPKVVHTIKDFSYLSVIEQRISEILNSEYMGVMGGDILKRFGAENMFSFPHVMENEDLLFVKDDEFNLALANASFSGIPRAVKVGSNPAYITNVLKYSVKVPASGATQLVEIRAFMARQSGISDVNSIDNSQRNNYDRVIVNLPDDVEATPETIMLATRFWYNIKKENTIAPDPEGQGILAEIDSCGTVLTEYCELYTISGTQVVVTPTVWNASLHTMGMTTESKYVMAAAAQYHIVPRLSLPFYEQGVLKGWFDAGAVDNFGLLAHNQMKRLNYVAISSIFTEVNVSPYGFPVRGGSYGDK